MAGAVTRVTEAADSLENVPEDTTLELPEKKII